MTSCSIEIESAMIWMGKQIGRELVVIPDKSRFNIVLDAMEGNLGKLLVHHKLVEALHTHIDGESSRAAFQGCFFCRSGSSKAKIVPSFHASSIILILLLWQRHLQKMILEDF